MTGLTDGSVQKNESPSLLGPGDFFIRVKSPGEGNPSPETCREVTTVETERPVRLSSDRALSVVFVGVFDLSHILFRLAHLSRLEHRVAGDSLRRAGKLPS